MAEESAMPEGEVTAVETPEATAKAYAARLRDLGRFLPEIRLPEVRFPAISPTVRTWGSRAAVGGAAGVLAFGVIALTRGPTAPVGNQEPAPTRSAPSLTPSGSLSPFGERTPRLWDELRREPPSAPTKKE